MKDPVPMPDSSCLRARDLWPAFADGDLPAGESAWLEQHLATCAGCREALAAFSAVDRELTAWGETLSHLNPPPAGAREQLSARLRMLPARTGAIRWIPAAACIAAALMLMTFLPHPRPGRPLPARAGFIEIPYLPPLDPHENTAIVRMNIPIATLIAAGYKVAADPGAVVPAEILVGQDGRAHAVRVLTDINLQGTGD